MVGTKTNNRLLYSQFRPQADALACQSIVYIQSIVALAYLLHLQQPAWGRSREFEITTRSVGRNGLTQTTTGDLEEDEQEEEEDDGLVHGRRKRKVAFMPSLGTCQLHGLSKLIDLHPRHYAHHLLPRSLAKSKCSGDSA